MPEFTTDANAAATALDVSVRRIADLSLDDVAKGAQGGKFRYVDAVHDPSANAKVREVMLLRSEGVVADSPAEWNGMSKDINEGRGRSCLYLVWK